MRLEGLSFVNFGVYLYKTGKMWLERRTLSIINAVVFPIPDSLEDTGD